MIPLSKSNTKHLLSLKIIQLSFYKVPNKIIKMADEENIAPQVPG